MLRAQENERVSIEDLRTLSLPLPNGKSVPLSAVATLNYVQDYPLIWRRDRLPTLTVQGNVKGDVLPATIVSQLKGKIDELNGSLPSGYKIVVGGAVEESAKSEASVMAVMPVVLLLFMATLMIQLENFKHLVLVLSVAPLGLIGVVFSLLMTGQPLGFVALLGIVALIGMIVRNSVILVHQIEVERHEGHSDWQAVVNAATLRFRPIMLTAFVPFGHGSHRADRFLGADGNCHHGGFGCGDRLNSDLLAVALCFVVPRSRRLRGSKVHGE